MQKSGALYNLHSGKSVEVSKVISFPVKPFDAWKVNERY